MDNIYEALGYVQSHLAVPKDQRNEFGGYMYRNLESINREAKPLCAEVGAMYYLNDSIQQIGDRYYVVATATFCFGDNYIQAVGYAREQSAKKGMDEAQVTGSASSYARKYALCALFAIDGEEDPDEMDNRDMGHKDTQMAESQVDRIDALVESFAVLRGKTFEDVRKALVGTKTLQSMGVKDLDTMTGKQAEAAIKVLESWVAAARKDGTDD